MKPKQQQCLVLCCPETCPSLIPLQEDQTGALPSTPCIRNPKLPRNPASKRYFHYSSFQIHTLEHNASFRVLKEMPSLGELRTGEIKEKAVMQIWPFKPGNLQGRSSQQQKVHLEEGAGLGETCPHVEYSVSACSPAGLCDSASYCSLWRVERHKTIHWRKCLISPR